MKSDWITSSVVSWAVAALCVAPNAALGVFNLNRHRYANATLNWGCVGVIIGINIANHFARKKLREHQEQLARLQEQREAQLGQLRLLQERQNEMITPEAAKRARMNLERVVNVFKAEIIGNLCVRLKVQGQYFQVNYGAVHRLTPDGNDSYEATCIQNGDGLPPEENVASVLLLLHNDPSIFYRWARMDRPYA